MGKLKILVLFDADGKPPVDRGYAGQLESSGEAEFDVARAGRFADCRVNCSAGRQGGRLAAIHWQR